MLCLSNGDRCSCGGELPWERVRYGCMLMTWSCASCGRVYRFVEEGRLREEEVRRETGRTVQSEHAARLRAERLARELARALERAGAGEEVLSDLNASYPSWRTELRALL